MQRLLSVRETADRLGLKPGTIRAWLLRRKHLPYVRCGRVVRIPAQAVERFIAANMVSARERR
jgi:excisionase family DNA binding protein